VYVSLGPLKKKGREKYRKGEGATIHPTHTTKKPLKTIAREWNNGLPNSQKDRRRKKS